MPANLPNTIYICATARLARALQTALNQAQQAAGHTQWQTPKVQTLQQWLQETVSFAMLSGEIAPESLPAKVLDHFSEKLLWQNAIEQCLQKHELRDLFDIPNLAQTAMQANQHLLEWLINDAQINNDFMSSETRQFLRWRAVFQRFCATHNTLEPARLLVLQADVIANTKLPLPQKMVWLGFDRITPLEHNLIHALSSKNVLVEMGQTQAQSPQIAQAACDDIHAECRAAVAWAKAQLDKNPQANLAIISPVLSHVRRLLGDLLDDAFHPEALQNSEAERIYDFSLGLALSEQAIARTALALLRVCASQKPLEQANLSALLLDVYWGDFNELDARSLLDARIRKKLTRSFSLPQLIEITSINQLLNHLKHIQATRAIWQKNLPPSSWVQHFSALLQALNWAQTRALSSFEHQAKQKWTEVLSQFSALDSLLGSISATEAVQKLQQLCSATMFQPEAGQHVQIQVLGMLESLATPADAIWVLGMNDQHWPPPAAPNAMLPAALQRDLQTPGANPDAQFMFAQKIHQRLCSSAAEVIFSWSHKDHDRELRPSPLLAGISAKFEVASMQTLAEQLAQPAAMQMLNDHTAPPLTAAEQVRGGSKLFEAQAICPAWAFYQYRLGAKKLETPTEGLDSMARGNLVHAVLQHFWLSCQDSHTLKSLSPDALQTSIDAAVGKALQTLKDEHNVHLPAQIIQIERQRLQQLLHAWLVLEKQRADFSVQACEATHTLNIEGLEITCRIDRIDALASGDLVVIDYKTGTPPALKTWADARIHEPQLPLYASLALQNNRVVAACFARVNIEECKLSGLAAEPDLMPNLSAFGKLKSNSTFVQFADFDALIAHWQTSLQTIALEIKNGVADVKFKDENDLLYCDVKPLLRLPERQLQFEKFQFEQSSERHES